VKPAVSVEKIGKKYRLKPWNGDQEYASLRVALTNALKMPFGRSEHRASTEVWAVRDVSFDVKPGEVLGVVGRNGAGKSTLLKMLSRITWPSEGCARMRGRVASLLEVGTGFHPELTGRENVLLNGSILGMRRHEILRRFDEIVAFAEVERYIDTPVKRYSSGMYLRLAFAVAAHLDPEILLVDEVLAVGDAQFQRRCLAKMQDVVRSNRTILFVSHNMQAVQSLCHRVVMLDGGQLVANGEPAEVIARYLAAGSAVGNTVSWPIDKAPGDDEFKLIGVDLSCTADHASDVFPSSKDVSVTLTFDSVFADSRLCVGFDLMSADGTTVLTTFQTDQPESEWPAVRRGRNVFRCTIPSGLLNRGKYYVSPRVKVHGTSLWKVKIDGVLDFEIVLDHGRSPFWAAQAGNRPGLIAPVLAWSAA
jgi:lipopolysaccharide transport system ATP-binding protein